MRSASCSCPASSIRSIRFSSHRASASSLLSFFIYFGCALGTATFAGLFGFGSGIGSADISSTDPATFLEGFGFAMVFGVAFSAIALILSAVVRERRGQDVE